MYNQLPDSAMQIFVVVSTRAGSLRGKRDVPQTRTKIPFAEKRKNTLKILFDGCHLRFEHYLEDLLKS